MRKVFVAGLAVMALLGGCAHAVAGDGAAQQWDPTRVAGLPITAGPSGLRPGVPDARPAVSGSDGGRFDRLAGDAVDDVQAYWKQALPKVYRPVNGLASYDSREAGRDLCGAQTQGLVNAFYCGPDDSIAWDRGVLLPSLAGRFGDMAVVAVLAHEIGHAVQTRLGAAGASSIVREQQADCYAGSYFRWVAEGDSPRFRISTGPGLNQILATLFTIRDSPGTPATAAEAHGSAFDRVGAFQLGFGDGPQRCGRIDDAEVARRVSPEQNGGAGPESSLSLTDRDARDQLAETVAGAFGGTQPRLVTDEACTDGHAAGYCAARNAVALDLPALDRIGRLGDFAAFAEVVSRYSLALQQTRGLALEGMPAAQRTACLTGYWAGTIVPARQRALQLSAGDLDEAVAELLDDDSLIAADVRGSVVPSGFARVSAFRDGFTAGSSTAATPSGAAAACTA